MRIADVTQCSYRLRDFVKGQSEAVKQSRQLQDKTQKLVKFSDSIGKSPQDAAEFLIELCGFENKSLETLSIDAAPLIKTIIDDFSKVEDAKRYDIDHSWQDFLVQTAPNKADLILRLTHERATPLAKAVGDLLNDEPTADANALTMALLNKSFAQCNESDIGICRGQLWVLVDYHPPRPQQPPLLPLAMIIPVIDPLSPDEPTTENPLIEILRSQINSAKLPDEQVCEILQYLLNDYA